MIFMKIYQNSWSAASSHKKEIFSFIQDFS